MKKNIIPIVILLVLAGGTLWFYTRSGGSTIKKELSDFAVEDTAAIDKIFMADKANKTITLERRESGNGWTLNGNYKARQDAVNNLLFTIKKLKVRSPVSKAGYETVIKNMAGNSTKIEIYQGKNKPVKVYYVGGSSPDHMGSFMLLEGSSVPFVMHLEGHYGFLHNRYFTNENEWRHRGIFEYEPHQIASITLEYPEYPEKSWELSIDDNAEVSLKHLASGEFVKNIDTVKIAKYIALYQLVHYDQLVETKSTTFKDSVVATVPRQRYTVKDVLGFSKTVNVYIKEIEGGGEDLDGNPITIDMDRLYAYIDNNTFATVQYIIFDPLKKEIKDFVKTKN
jgi:hypothetical protein